MDGMSYDIYTGLLKAFPLRVDGDNHVVTHVYMNAIHKWIMLDPTFNAYFTNERGEYLSLLDIRHHLADQEPVFFNDEAKYNDEVWTAQSAQESVEYYAKDLFYMQTMENSRRIDLLHFCRV